MSGNYFSADKCQFFIGTLKDSYIAAGTWPDDAVEVDSEIEAKYSALPPDDKILGADSSGLPVWSDKPAPTQDELISETKDQQEVMITEAKDTISIWQSELLLGTISDDDKASLTAWISYINELQALDFSSITDEASYNAFVWLTKPTTQTM
ncbi:tail fiber assembly protein [Mangrovibacter sp. SLW1]